MKGSLRAMCAVQATLPSRNAANFAADSCVSCPARSRRRKGCSASESNAYLTPFRCLMLHPRPSSADVEWSCKPKRGPVIRFFSVVFSAGTECVFRRGFRLPFAPDDNRLRRTSAFSCTQGPGNRSRLAVPVPDVPPAVIRATRHAEFWNGPKGIFPLSSQFREQCGTEE